MMISLQARVPPKSWPAPKPPKGESSAQATLEETIEMYMYDDDEESHLLRLGRVGMQRCGLPPPDTL